MNSHSICKHLAGNTDQPMVYIGDEFMCSGCGSERVCHLLGDGSGIGPGRMSEMLDFTRCNHRGDGELKNCSVCSTGFVGFLMVLASLAHFNDRQLRNSLVNVNKHIRRHKAVFQTQNSDST